jgi:hypothetical protein
MNKGLGLVGLRRSPDQKRYGALGCYAGFDPGAGIARIEIPQCSSLLSHRAVLFLSIASMEGGW